MVARGFTLRARAVFAPDLRAWGVLAPDLRAWGVLVPLFLAACDAETVSTGIDAGYGTFPDAMLADGRVVRGPYATRVVSFTPGEGATFGQNGMPGIVLGPPQGTGDSRGSTDVVSLGRSGEIVLAFDDVIITDGPGTDFVVFENPFSYANGTRWWEELGQVSVSEDGIHWAEYQCDQTTRPHTGCAGWNPVYSSPDNGIPATDPAMAGGDPFDLATVGLRRARYVRIQDRGTQPLMPPSTGFDLDAIAVVHGQRQGD